MSGMKFVYGYLKVRSREHIVGVGKRHHYSVTRKKRHGTTVEARFVVSPQTSPKWKMKRAKIIQTVCRKNACVAGYTFFFYKSLLNWEDSSGWESLITFYFANLYVKNNKPKIKVTKNVKLTHILKGWCFFYTINQMFFFYCMTHISVCNSQQFLIIYNISKITSTPSKSLADKVKFYWTTEKYLLVYKFQAWHLFLPQSPFFPRHLSEICCFFFQICCLSSMKAYKIGVNRPRWSPGPGCSKAG